MTETAKKLIKELIEYMGDDPDRAGLKDTPARVVASWAELFSGYRAKAEDVVKMFEDGAERYDEFVVVRNVDFYSTCEHHLLPFWGKAHAGYIPDKRVVGLSKLPRLVDVFARRLQVQERITTQVADAMHEFLQPHGCGVVLEASHGCMGCRGVRQPASVTVTSAVRGCVRVDAACRAEFFRLIRG